MSHVRGRRPVGAVLALALAAIGASATVLAGPVQADSTEGVTICHVAGKSGRWVVITVDASALIRNGHRAHQGGHDVIPPFEHTAEGAGSTRLAGQNWADNWPVDPSGRATGAVEASDCGAAPRPDKPQKKEKSAEKQQAKPGDEQEGKPGDKRGRSGEKRSDPPPRGEGGGSSASPSGATGSRAPDDAAEPRPALVGGGLALLLAGGATAVGVTRRRGQ
ncbi:hypothetical protein ACOCJ4_05415 [Knoellia sp. CPCC 206435]|uniref:hypothetical protein n=1 Tax=Knoellia terrae TaxID=3404797 RepID=UPI003B43306C